MNLLSALMLVVACANWTPPAAPEPAPKPAAAPAKTTPAGPTAADAEFEKRLADLDAKAEAVVTLRARFVQKKFTPLLKKPLESSGRVVMKGDRTRWETTEPRKSVMTLGRDGLRIYYPDQKVVELYDLGDDVREVSASPLPRTSRLREAFNVSSTKPSRVGGKDDDSSLLALELVPSTEELKKHVDRVRVLIDTTVPAVRRIEIEDLDGERTEIDFKHIEVNEEIEDSDVTLEVPKGTREVRPLGESQPRRAKDDAK